jgi:hypothetical protein
MAAMHAKSVSRDHNGAGFLPYCAQTRPAAEIRMRFLFGVIMGGLLTVGGAYVADKIAAAPDAKPMVNWDVVAMKWDHVTALAREGWKKISG